MKRPAAGGVFLPFADRRAKVLAARSPMLTADRQTLTAEKINIRSRGRNMRDGLEYVAGSLGRDLWQGGRRSGAADAYRAAELMTATPGRLAELLHEGAIGLCRQAIEALDAGENERAADCLGRARRIFLQIQNSLPPDGRSPLAQQLADLYEQAHGRLIEADHYRRREAVAETISMLTFERPAWAELIDPARRRSATAAAANPLPPHAGWIG